MSYQAVSDVRKDLPQLAGSASSALELVAYGAKAPRDLLIHGFDNGKTLLDYLQRCVNFENDSRRFVSAEMLRLGSTLEFIRELHDGQTYLDRLPEISEGITSIVSNIEHRRTSARTRAKAKEFSDYFFSFMMTYQRHLPITRSC
jgi:hypothetical protein